MRKKILVVDDDDGVRESLMNALSYENYAPLGAMDGEEALAILEKEEVELVLLDLNMPRRNGWETYEALSEKDPLLPIIIITARPNQLFTSLGAGVGALVEKPFDFLKLVEMIRSLIAEGTEKRMARATGQA
ncbi:MAG TPA: response regulator, partial [Verrucomicrobiae bacterium]|nr:response regulator [Verrucomicrobiae bacterium]